MRLKSILFTLLLLSTHGFAQNDFSTEQMNSEVPMAADPDEKYFEDVYIESDAEISEEIQQLSDEDESEDEDKVEDAYAGEQNFEDVLIIQEAEAPKASVKKQKKKIRKKQSKKRAKRKRKKTRSLKRKGYTLRTSTPPTWQLNLGAGYVSQLSHEYTPGFGINIDLLYKLDKNSPLSYGLATQIQFIPEDYLDASINQNISRSLSYFNFGPEAHFGISNFAIYGMIGMSIAITDVSYDNAAVVPQSYADQDSYVDWGFALKIGAKYSFIDLEQLKIYAFVDYNANFYAEGAVARGERAGQDETPQQLTIGAGAQFDL